MKQLLVGISLFFICASSNAETIRLSEPVATDEQYETFGEILNTSLPTVSLVDLLGNSEDNLGKAFILNTKIAKVCQKKGCFFIAQENDQIIRISFKDYAFFIPTDSTNKMVTIAGELVAKDRSPEQAAHFNQDLKTTNEVLDAGKVYEIVAQSIRIPLN